MVLLPIFWDQHDNAQRLHEEGFRIRLDTYRLATRMPVTSARLRPHGGPSAIDLIERAILDLTPSDGQLDELQIVQSSRP